MDRQIKARKFTGIPSHEEAREMVELHVASENIKKRLLRYIRAQEIFEIKRG